MAHKVTDFNGSIVAPGTPYQYGQIKDVPSGTRADVVSNGDMIQFFQRVAGFWGVALNSLPDNDVNGYQFVQALNLFVGSMGAGVAALFNGIGSNVAVRGSGMVATTVSCDTTISTGWFIYNDQLVYFKQSSYDSCISPGPGNAVMVVISTTDALVTASVAVTTNTTTSMRFPLANLVTWSAATGIDEMEADIVALETVTALGAWTNITLGTGWVSLNTPQYRICGNGQVFLRGSAEATVGATTTFGTIGTSGGRPAVSVTVPVYASISGTPTPVIVDIDTSTGHIISPFTTNGDAIGLDGITYLNS